MSIPRNAPSAQRFARVTHVTSTNNDNVWRKHISVMHGWDDPQVRGYNYVCGFDGEMGARRVTPNGDVAAIDGDWRTCYYNVYPVHKIRESVKSRGKAKDTIGAGGVGVDYDGKDVLTDEEIAPFKVEPVLTEGMTKKGRNDAIKDARNATKLAAIDALRHLWEPRLKERLAAIPFQPSMTLFSGGGFHCYWYFTEFQGTQNDESRDVFRAFLRAWVDFVGGDGGAKDIARILRVAGTYNMKYPSGPKLCEIVEFHPDRRYDPRELMDALPADWRNPARRTAARREARLTGSGQSARWDSELPNSYVVREFNRAHRGENIERFYDLLEEYGATPDDQHKTRWTDPHQSSSSGIHVNPDAGLAYWYTSSNVWGKAEVTKFAADLLLVNRFDGDVDACMAWLKENYGDKAPFNFDYLAWYAKRGEFATHVKERQVKIAEEAEKKAEAADARYVDDPSDENKRIAIRLRKRAEKMRKAADDDKYRTEMNDRKVATALVTLAQNEYRKSGSEHFYPGGVTIARVGNVSERRVYDVLERLAGWFVEFVQREEGKAPVLTFGKIALMTDVIPYTDTTSVINAKLDGTVGWDTHYNHDNFPTRSVTPRERTARDEWLVMETYKALLNGTDSPERQEEFRRQLWEYVYDALDGADFKATRRQRREVTRTALEGETFKTWRELRSAVERIHARCEHRRVANVMREAMREFRALNDDDLVIEESSLTPEEAHKLRLMRASHFLFTQQRRWLASRRTSRAGDLWLLDFVVEAGGKMEIRDLCEASGKSPEYVSRTIGRLIDDGICEKADYYTVAILPDCDLRVNDLVRGTANFGTGAIRTARWLDLQINRLNDFIEEATFQNDGARVARLQKILRRYTAERKELDDWAIDNLPDLVAARVMKRHGATGDDMELDARVEDIDAEIEAEHEFIATLEATGDTPETRRAATRARANIEKLEREKTETLKVERTDALLEEVKHKAHEARVGDNMDEFMANVAKNVAKLVSDGNTPDDAWLYLSRRMRPDDSFLDDGDDSPEAMERKSRIRADLAREERVLLRALDEVIRTEAWQRYMEWTPPVYEQGALLAA